MSDIIDRKLGEDVEPYLAEVRRLTTPPRVASVVNQLKADITGFRRRGWIKEQHSIIANWKDRVTRFRDNTDVIKLRIHPYQRVPELVTSETRQAILETAMILREHLGYRRRLGSMKSVVADFSADRVTIAQLDQEWSRVGEAAAAAI